MKYDLWWMEKVSSGLTSVGNDPVFSLVYKKGTIISVPANTKHWFDMGLTPCIKAIRIFTDDKGWEANYTNSGIEKKYVT